MSVRSIPYIVFCTLFIVSTACSLAIRAGHADVPIAESADLIDPLGHGDNAPQFVVETVAGEPFDFNPTELKRPVVLLTFRGGWCPFCNVYLSEMRNVIPEIRAMGVDVLFLSGDRSEVLFDSLTQETQDDISGLDYTILSDADAQAAIALGIAFRVPPGMNQRMADRGRDIDGSSIAEHGVLPVPSVFAIGRDGVIQFAYTNPDYKVRLPADDLVAAVRGIAPAE